MPFDRLPGALLPLTYLLAVLVLSALGTWWVVRKERKEPSSYTRSAEYLASMTAWRKLSAAAQEAVDNAALDMAEQAEIDAREDAQEAARFLDDRVRVSSLYHP